MQAVTIIPPQDPQPKPNQRYVHCPFTEFVQTLNVSQRNCLRVLLHDTAFEHELALALGMLTGVPVGGWQKERLNNLVEIGFASDRGETIKRRLAELNAR